MKDAKTFWDKMAARYAKNPIKDMSSYQRKLEITQSYFQEDWSVMEFGCGTGSTAIIHAPYVKEIIATDISDNMLAIGEQRAKEAGVDNVRFQQGTLASLNFDDARFDAVLGLNILHLIDDVDAALAHVHKSLKPGGIFVSSTGLLNEMFFLWRLVIPVMQLLGMAPYVNCFDKQTLIAKLETAGFSVEQEWCPAKGSVFLVAKKA